jgi:selenoprotein W-related protein
LAWSSIGLSVAAYLPQMAHLAEERRSAEEQHPRWMMWLASGLLIRTLALHRRNYGSSPSPPPASCRRHASSSCHADSVEWHATPEMSASVEIEYCVPCGHLDRAIDTQRAILQQFGRRVDGVRLKTGHGGVFTIRVDSEQIYDRTRGYDLAGILEEINTRL